MTDFLEPFAVSGPDAAMKIEYQQGVNMAKAALRIPTLEHYIWSVLPNSAKGLGWEARRDAFCCEEQDRRVHPVETGITRKDDILLYHVLREQSAIPRLRADQSRERRKVYLPPSVSEGDSFLRHWESSHKLGDLGGGHPLSARFD
jgi:hypothetical protein